MSQQVRAVLVQPVRPLQDPLAIFEPLTERELRELLAEICRRAQLDAARRDFWAGLRVLCEHQQTEMNARGRGGGGGSGGDGGAAVGLNSAVNADVAQMLAGKSAAELDELRDQISHQLQVSSRACATLGTSIVLLTLRLPTHVAQDDEAVDTDYWRTVQQQLDLARARCVVLETHARVLARKAEFAVAAGPTGEEPPACYGVARDVALAADEPAIELSGRFSPTLNDEEDEEVDALGATDDAVPTGRDAAESGRYSPPLLRAHQVVSEKVTSTAEDWRVLQEERARIRRHAQSRPQAGAAGGGAASAASGSSSAAASGGAAAAEGAPDDGGSALVDAEAQRGMEQGEARFSFEVPLERKVTWWHDKYRPRKPKYFNRVHTGYEWNKYNQTHYDHDNPPPKMVQGYKFAVFYPDLIDRTQTPTYSLLPDPSGAKDTCILRFRGGPPYEDIAFKIVNNEWEHSHKRGFKCRFERGILQLHFNFKRHRYRR